MDPLSAVSLAGNILQFVEVGIRVVSKGHKIYRSVDGCLMENLDLEIVTSDLLVLQKKIQTSKLCEPVTGTEMDQSQALQTLAERCSDLAEELLEKLNKAKAQGRFRKWKSLRQALKSVWSQKEVDGMANRLQSFRSEIQLQLLISVR